MVHFQRGRTFDTVRLPQRLGVNLIANSLKLLIDIEVYIARSDEALIASENLDDLDYKFGICHKERCGRGTIYGIDDYLSVEVDALQKRLQISRARKAGSG